MNDNKVNCRFVILFLCIVTLALSAFTIYNLYLIRDMNDIRIYLYIIAGVVTFLDLVFFFKVRYRFKKKRKKKKKNKGLIFSLILFMIFNILIGGAISYVYGYLGTLSKEVSTYTSYLVTLSGNKAKTPDDLDEATIAILDDKYSPEGYIIPQKMIKEYNLDANNKIKKYNDYSSMIADLYSKDLDAIFVGDNYVSTYSSIEAFQNIKSETKIIAHKSERIKKSSISKKEQTSNNKSIDKPFTILLMGVDSTDETLGKNAIANGDSLILITFNPKRLNATMLSIPRDSYVPIACWNDKAENKITHAAAYGNDCMINTIEDYFDIPIDYYVKINFKGLVKLVNAVDGIDVDVPKDLCTDSSDRKGQVCIQGGRQHLDGEEALVLARNRKQLAAGDLDRGQNQQLVIKALIDKIKSINNISQFKEVLDAVSENMDTNLNNKQIISFYNVARDINKSSLATKNSDIVDIDQMYLQGNGATIFDSRMRMNLWNYVPVEQSRADIEKAMKVNLDIKKYKPIKKFSFSINKPYEKKVVGYGPYTATKVKYIQVPNFVGDTKYQASKWAKAHGMNVKFVGTGNTVTAQDYRYGKKVASNNVVTLTLGK